MSDSRLQPVRNGDGRNLIVPGKLFVGYEQAAPFAREAQRGNFAYAPVNGPDQG